MALSKHEQAIWNEIKQWEYQLAQQESTDFQLTFDKWLSASVARIPEKRRTDFFATADKWLFHLHAFIQSSQSQFDARNRILSAARLFDDGIEQIEDVQRLEIYQLDYIAEHQVARHRLYSFIQGGATGAGGILLLGADFPLIIALNLKAVQMIAMTYGYDVNRPYEMMLALKVFHAGILPARLQQYAWRDLMEELEQPYDPFFYSGDDEVLTVASTEIVLKQIVKTYIIHLLRRKLIQGIPLFGIAVGSTVNYRLTRAVTSFAHRFYQMRYLKARQ